ncbi:MAG TPA: hypothetical protein VKQ36_11005, partial [Ktedonobacterales bacterium]|nr:hypothetical protein [Ktedonobacterales bacterium]
SVREASAVAATLAVALWLRLALAARGWPALNSDQATFGLMVDDILHGRAFPIFLYGQHYLGALQAYLDAPLFALLGPTSFTLHLALTIQTLLAFLVLYVFTRSVFSPPIAWATLALLALGPTQSLVYELYPGTHTQDILLYGALLLWLTMLRMRQPTGAKAHKMKVVLLFGVGVAAGLGFWGTFLITPFIAVTLFALAAYGLMRLRPQLQAGATTLRRSLWGATHEAAALVVGAGLTLTPFLIASFASHWVVIHEVFSAADGGVKPQGTPSLLDHLIAYWRQGLGVFFVGLPSLFYRSVVCPSCVPWPAPSANATPQQAWQAALVSAPISLIVIGFWVIAAAPLARDIFAALRSTLQRLSASPVLFEGSSHRVTPVLVGATPAHRNLTDRDAQTSSQPFDPRWWGRWMLVVASALTMLIYLTSGAAYLFPGTSSRYLLGLYLCWPLLVAPLWRGTTTLALSLWRWATASNPRGAVLTSWSTTLRALAPFSMRATPRSNMLD